MFNRFVGCWRKIHQRIISISLFSCGNDFNVFGKAMFMYPEKISIGSGVTVNHGVYLNAYNPISIGNDVTISAYAAIVSTGIDYLSWSGGKKVHLKNQGVVIGDHVWIGCGAKILSGVHITGQYVVIAAGSIVTKNITEDYVIIAGCPAKVIKKYR